eukprot:303182_1
MGDNPSKTFIEEDQTFPSYTQTYSSTSFDAKERQRRVVGNLIIGGIKGIANIGVTAASAITDDRTYYNCPRCKRRVYAYGAYVGNVCNDCPGTVLSAIGNSASMLTLGLAEPIAQTMHHVGPKIASIPTDIAALGVEEIRAEYSASCVWYISKGSSIIEADSNKFNSYRSEKIIYVSSRSVGIRSGLVDNTLPSHWWMIIETTSSYYNIQFRKSGSKIELRRGSKNDCDESGLAEAVRVVGTEPIHENSYSCSVKNKTLGDIVDWLDEGHFSSYYNLISNNCQNLCKEIYKW